MTPDRKAALVAECDALSEKALEMTPAQQIVVEVTQAAWGGEELTPAMERWAARQLHLSPERWRSAVNSVWAQAMAAEELTNG
jgi:hypothetical protein